MFKVRTGFEVRGLKTKFLVMTIVDKLEYALNGQAEPLPQFRDGRTTCMLFLYLGVAFLERLLFGRTGCDVVKSGYEVCGSLWNGIEIVERFAPRNPDRGNACILVIS